MAIALLVATVASLAALTVGVMGLVGRHPRNHIAGIRTAGTLASDEAWREAHRAGSAPLIFGAVAAFMAGLAFLPFVLAGKVGDTLAVVVVTAQAGFLAGGTVVAWLIAERTARGAR